MKERNAGDLALTLGLSLTHLVRVSVSYMIRRASGGLYQTQSVRFEWGVHRNQLSVLSRLCSSAELFETALQVFEGMQLPFVFLRIGGWHVNVCGDDGSDGWEVKNCNERCEGKRLAYTFGFICDCLFREELCRVDRSIDFIPPAILRGV